MLPYIYIVYMGIHDETIRKILEEKEEEIALLELAFPEESKNLFNLDSVQNEKDSFVIETESENRFDLLLSVDDVFGNKRRIYFLFEHKSYWDTPTLSELLGFSQREKESFEKFLPFILYVMHCIRHDDFLEFIDEALREVGKIHFQEDSKGIDKFRLFVHYLNKARR
jgi:hypothetical protein